MTKFLRYIVNRGIKEGDSMELRRQKGLLNIASLFCFAALSLFVTFNIIEHKWILLVSNSVLLTLTTSLLFISRLKHLNTSIFILSFLFSVYFFITALLFRNGLEFAIIIMMPMSVLLISNRVARRCMLAIQITLFCAFMYWQKIPAIIPPLPGYRIYIIVILLLVILACVLEYFKTKQLQYIKDLNKVNEALVESNRVKERMLSILSHDFNAPVGSLATMLELFENNILTETEFRDVSVKLKSQLQVLTMSLADVLHWSKMQISGNNGNAGYINMAELMEKILQLFHPTLGEKNIILQNDIQETVTVYAYEDHLKLIFRNLLSNAIKFSYRGGTIFLYTNVYNGTTTVCIRDEGTGIQPAILEALQKEELKFNSSPGTAKEKGTGLGLMLVREFLYKNNGSLTIQSAPGKGSTFSVTLREKK